MSLKNKCIILFFFSLFSLFFFQSFLSNSHFFVQAFLLIVFIFLLIGFFGVNQDKVSITYEKTKIFKTVFVSTAFGLLCYFLIHSLDIDSVIAASYLGLLAYFLLAYLQKNSQPDLAPPAYAGVFLGMTASSVLSAPAVFIGSILVGIIYILSAELFHGCGGKLGAIAFLACFLLILITNFFGLNL